MIFIRAGDVELNPKPESGMSDEISDIIAKNFSVVHYNVQSALYKIDFLESELANFDLISITELRKLMRKRKCAYDKAKQTRRTEQWNKYKTIRNDTNNLLRSSKQTYFDILSETIKPNNNLNSKD